MSFRLWNKQMDAPHIKLHTNNQTGNVEYEISLRGSSHTFSKISPFSSLSSLSRKQNSIISIQLSAWEKMHQENRMNAFSLPSKNFFLKKRKKHRLKRMYNFCSFQQHEPKYVYFIYIAYFYLCTSILKT